MGESIDTDSILILDKETNRHVVIVSPGEYHHKDVPEFNGTGDRQDPLQFIEDFKKAARWNNWRTDARKKKMFVLGLIGHAERWIKNYRAENYDIFEALPFDKGSEDSVLNLFKKTYVTDEWLEAYMLEYEKYKQSATESPLEYLEKKRYLLLKADPSNQERSIKQQVRVVLHGLTPSVKHFCESKIKDLL